jgi:glycosyltransferase domain-containing protein
MRERITVIIPTHERHHVLLRTIDYYRQINVSILIVDSSSVFLDKELPVNIKYLHLPNSFFGDKIYTALCEVSTPYSCLCADDDFLSESGLYFGIRYLEENKDYASVQGNYVHFEYDNGLVNYHPVYAETIGIKDVSSNNPIDRLMKSIGMGHSLIYALHHTETLQECLKTVLDMKAVSFVEKGISIISPLHGKHIILPIFWMARDKERYSEYFSEKGGSYVKNINNKSEKISDLNMFIDDFNGYLNTDKGIQFRKNFINSTINILHDSSVCDKLFDRYFINISLNRVKLHKRVAEHYLKTAIKKSMPSAILSFYYKKINTKEKIAEKQRNQFIDSLGYPWSNDEARHDWNKMKSVILEHGDLTKR